MTESVSALLTLLAGLHEEVAAREGASAGLEERDVAKPAPVRPPAVLEAHRRGQSLLDRVEPAYVPLDLQRLDGEAA